MNLLDTVLNLGKGGFGNMANDNNMMLIGVVVALVVGVGIGYFGGSTIAPQKVSLNDADKNFLVQVANAQVDLTTRFTGAQAAQAAALDWCTVNGGQWNLVQQPAVIPVSAQAAQQLQSSGYIVQQSQDGNYLARVAVLNQAGCVLPVAQQN